MVKIPIVSVPDKPISTSTQNHIEVADIAENLVLFKNGSVALVMESTSLNFGLLSEKEQEAVIAGFAALLNSLTFHIQIVVRSKQKDISGYINLIEKVEETIDNPKLKSIMNGYKTFITDSIKKKNVLSKKFYIVIPFTQYELGLTKSMTRSLGTGTNERSVPYTKAYVVRKAKIALYPKREHISRQAQRLGLLLRQLENDELIQLLYEVYNPDPPIKEKALL